MRRTDPDPPPPPPRSPAAVPVTEMRDGAPPPHPDERPDGVRPVRSRLGRAWDLLLGLLFP